MICKAKRCGKEIPDDAYFCPYCGKQQRPTKKSTRSDGLMEKRVTIYGKRISFYGKTEKEIQKKMLEYSHKEESRKIRGQQFDSVLEEWWDVHSGSLAYTTEKSYKAISKRIKEHFGQEAVTDISPMDCQAFIAQLGKRGFAYKTVSNHLIVLRMVFDYAVLNGMIQHNPTSSVKIPKGLKVTERLPVSADICKLIDNSVDKPFGLLAYLVRYTGLRRGEALALQGKHFLFDKKMILVERSVYWENNRPIIKLPKTRAGLRYAPLPDNVATKIKALKLKDDQLLFADQDGNLLTDSKQRDLWYQYLVSIGQAHYDQDAHEYKSNFQLHQLRHNYASDLYDLRIGEKEMEAFLGHTNAAFTRKQYVALRDPAMQSAISKINDFYTAT